VRSERGAQHARRHVRTWADDRRDAAKSNLLLLLLLLLMRMRMLCYVVFIVYSTQHRVVADAPCADCTTATRCVLLSQLVPSPKPHYQLASYTSDENRGYISHAFRHTYY